MYITCGRRGEDYLKELQCYDPKTDRWEVLADGPVRRAWHGMAALLGKLYVIGGSNNDSGYRRDVHQVRAYLCLSWKSLMDACTPMCYNVFLLLSKQIKLPGIAPAPALPNSVAMIYLLLSVLNALPKPQSIKAPAPGIPINFKATLIDNIHWRAHTQ